MGMAAVGIDLRGPERRELEGLAWAQKVGQALARRAWIVLAAASGWKSRFDDLPPGRG